MNPCPGCITRPVGRGIPTVRVKWVNECGSASRPVRATSAGVQSCGLSSMGGLAAGSGRLCAQLAGWISARPSSVSGAGRSMKPRARARPASGSRPAVKPVPRCAGGRDSTDLQQQRQRQQLPHLPFPPIICAYPQTYVYSPLSVTIFFLTERIRGERDLCAWINGEGRWCGSCCCCCCCGQACRYLTRPPIRPAGQSGSPVGSPAGSLL